jgi:predicted nucleotidyltransferase
MKADRALNIHPVIQTIRVYFLPEKEVLAVYLFGSYALGCPRPDSDIDLGLLFDDEKVEDIANKLETYNLALARMLRKDIHLTALNAASPLLMKQVLSKGSCILTNDPRKLAYFQMAALGKIADFAPYKTNCEREFVRKLVHG